MILLQSASQAEFFSFGLTAASTPFSLENPYGIVRLYTWNFVWHPTPLVFMLKSIPSSRVSWRMMLRSGTRSSPLRHNHDRCPNFDQIQVLVWLHQLRDCHYKGEKRFKSLVSHYQSFPSRFSMMEKFCLRDCIVTGKVELIMLLPVFGHSILWPCRQFCCLTFIF